MRDHLDFLCNVEIEEELTEPDALPKRIIRDRMNPLELRPLEFRVTFGMSKEFFKDLLDLLKPQLTREQQHNEGNLQPIHRLAIFLQFLCTNRFHKSVASQFYLRVSQSTVTITVNSVSRVVASLKSKYVQFPDMKEGNRIAKSLFDYTGFPGIIDRVHIEIMKPSTKNPVPEKFYNRKSKYSINAVMICDDEKRIRWFTCRHAGSAHDSRIWEESYCLH